MPSLDDWFSKNIKLYPWISPYKTQLFTIINNYSKEKKQSDDLKEELSDFFQSFSDPALAELRDDYMSRLLIPADELISLVMAYTRLGRCIMGNELLLKNQKTFLKSLAMTLRCSQAPMNLVTSIVKIWDAEPFLNHTGVEENLKCLLLHAECWFGDEKLKEAFDSFPTHLFKTEDVFDTLVALSRDTASSEELCLNITQHLHKILHPKDKPRTWFEFFTGKKHEKPRAGRTSSVELQTGNNWNYYRRPSV